MAPVEIDHVPRSIIAPVKNMKVVDKAMSLPLVSSAYSEVTRVTSPYMESTMTKVSPVVEMVSPMVDSVKTRVEEQLMTHVPTGISETVQNVQAKAVDQVIAAVEKVNVNWTFGVHQIHISIKVDSYACSGIDQLTEKVPQLKDATPKLIEETKAMNLDHLNPLFFKTLLQSSVSSFVTGWSEYFASFSVALVTLKVVDATLDQVETILKATECDTAKTVSAYVKTIHDTANTLRIGAVKSAGTPLAKKIEDCTIPESLMEVTGIQSVMERLGLVGGEVTEAKKDVTEEESIQEKVVETPSESVQEKVDEKLAEVPSTAEEVTKKISPKSKKGSKESSPVGDLM